MRQGVAVAWLIVAAGLIVDAVLSMLIKHTQAFWPWQVGRLFRVAAGIGLIVQYTGKQWFNGRTKWRITKNDADWEH